MRYGENWPAPQSGGGPAVTPPAAHIMKSINRYVDKWARLWLATHPGCHNHPTCQALRATQIPRD